MTVQDVIAAIPNLEFEEKLDLMDAIIQSLRKEYREMEYTETSPESSSDPDDSE
jgi:hypothetical protein